jgi:bacterioferritin-associated ferredoxin
MIVCSCNVLSDRDVRSAIEAERTRSTSRVYGCLGCSAKCGCCVRTIRRIIDEVHGLRVFGASAATQGAGSAIIRDGELSGRQA